MHGDYRLTREDVLQARRFDDEIALCGAPIEDHHAGGDTEWRYVDESGVYGIPYRSLLPQDVEGLLVAGRCFSATHDAHASARSMATCMAMGQAAGTAAAMAVASRTTPRSVDASRPARPASSRRSVAGSASRGVGPMTALELRRSPVAEAIRRHRLVVVLRRIEPREHLLTMARELADAGARIFEVTLDSAAGAEDLAALRADLGRRDDGPFLVGAGTVRTGDQLTAARGAGADFAVAPLLDLDLLRSSTEAGTPLHSRRHDPDRDRRGVGGRCNHGQALSRLGRRGRPWSVRCEAR